MKTASSAVERALSARRDFCDYQGPEDSAKWRVMEVELERSHAALEKAPILTLDDANAMVEFGGVDENDMACEVALRRGVDWLRGRASSEDAVAKGGVKSEWLTRSEAAAYAKLSPSHLAGLACEGKGPKYKKTGSHHVLYHLDDLDEWIRNNGAKPRRR